MEAKMKLCRKCNVSYDDPERIFCSKCGSTLVEANICPNCHTENSLDFAFCKKCGTKLDGSGAEGRVTAQVSQLPQINADGNLKKSSHTNWKIILGGIIVIVGIILALNKDDIALYLDYSKANRAFKNGDYFLASAIFSDLGDYKDSKTLMYSSMVAYVKSHMDKNDKYTEYFMKELKDNSPTDFQWDYIYHSIYGWTVDVINLSRFSDDYKENKSRTFIKGGTYYLHFRVKGGKKNERNPFWPYKIVTDNLLPTSNYIICELRDGEVGTIVINDLRSDYFSISFFEHEMQIGGASFRAEDYLDTN